MAVKQFPNDFSAGAATKLLGADAANNIVYIVVPAGGDTLQSILDRGFIADKGITLSGVIISKSSVNNNSLQINSEAFSGPAIIPSNEAGNADKNLFIAPFGGNVAIGGSGLGAPPTERLHVFGNILASGSIVPGSDKRLKKKIKTITGNLYKIKELRPVVYNHKYDDALAMGFIADEVREVLPELVLEGKDKEKMLALNYMGLTAPIVGAIQELSAMVDQLKAEIEELKAGK